MSRLLARYAASVFWLARYIERAENLARILDVQETFARNSQGSHDWSVVLAINSDVEKFAARYERPTADSVLHYYILDRSNPTSLAATLAAARENGRALRPLISTEMWVHLNIFYNKVARLTPRDASEARLSRLCALIKENCDAHFGITAGTFYRDEAWSFYQLGAAIERADQTTRLLDAKFLSLEARDDPVDPGSATDIGYWMSLLRSAAGYQAFRRTHPRADAPEQIAVFMICDPAFPRSVAHNLAVASDELTTLRRTFGLRAAGRALEHLDGMCEDLDARNVRTLTAKGELHRLNDWLQRGLIELTNRTASAFFA